MYAVVRRLRLVDRIRHDEVVQRLGEGLLADLAGADGAGACCLVTSETDEVLCLAFFDRRAAAEAGDRLIEYWVRHHVGPLVVDASDGLIGDVHMDPSSATASDEGSPHTFLPQ